MLDLDAIEKRLARAEEADAAYHLEQNLNADYWGVTDLWSEDVPALIAEVKARRAENERLRAIVDEAVRVFAGGPSIDDDYPSARFWDLVEEAGIPIPA